MFTLITLSPRLAVRPAGTKMVHIGKNTRSRIVSKGISAGGSRNAYRGLVKVRNNFVPATHSGSLEADLGMTRYFQHVDLIF